MSQRRLTWAQPVVFLPCSCCEKKNLQRISKSLLSYKFKGHWGYCYVSPMELYWKHGIQLPDYKRLVNKDEACQWHSCVRNVSIQVDSSFKVQHVYACCNWEVGVPLRWFRFKVGGYWVGVIVKSKAFRERSVRRPLLNSSTLQSKSLCFPIASRTIITIMYFNEQCGTLLWELEKQVNINIGPLMSGGWVHKWRSSLPISSRPLANPFIV